MEIFFKKGKTTYQADLSNPLDISIPLRQGDRTVNCFYAPFMEATPVVAGDFIGSTLRGGPVNFLNVRINPHGNGTHTECVGHIAKEKFTINQSLQTFHFFAKLVTVIPTKMENGDQVILKNQFDQVLQKGEADAVVIRTFPNHEDKLRRHYSGTNPTYLHHEATQYLVDCGIQHLFIDLPSVDREEDGGALLSHRTFWQYPDSIREHCTITELIFVEDKIKDGEYLLQLGIASFEIDVSPSKPILYKIKAIG
ncbi:MAG: cyclase family protein [Bacteroidota bacterium]